MLTNQCVPQFFQQGFPCPRHYIDSERINQMHLPIAVTFFQFQSPKWSSSVSRRIPGLISFVLDANRFVFAHPRSGASPSVLPTPGSKLNENSVRHFSTCAFRWNLGTSNVKSSCSLSTCK